MILKKDEKETEENYGSFYSIKSNIERKTLRSPKVAMTSYHIGDLVGNPARRLMKYSNKIFKDIFLSTYLIFIMKKIRNNNDRISNEEVKVI